MRTRGEYGRYRIFFPSNRQRQSQKPTDKRNILFVPFVVWVSDFLLMYGGIRYKRRPSGKCARARNARFHNFRIVARSDGKLGRLARNNYVSERIRPKRNVTRGQLLTQCRNCAFLLHQTVAVRTSEQKRAIRLKFRVFGFNSLAIRDRSMSSHFGRVLN